jgi:hypothetical protein
MARYSCVTDKGEFFRKDEPFREFVEKPDDIPHKKIRWLPLKVVPSPPLDQTHGLDGPFYRIKKNAVEEYFVEIAAPPPPPPTPEISAAEKIGRIFAGHPELIAALQEVADTADRAVKATKVEL